MVYSRSLKEDRKNCWKERKSNNNPVVTDPTRDHNLKIIIMKQSRPRIVRRVVEKVYSLKLSEEQKAVKTEKVKFWGAFKNQKDNVCLN